MKSRSRDLLLIVVALLAILGAGFGLGSLVAKRLPIADPAPPSVEVHKLEISGHADRRELMNFMKRLSPKPRKVMVNHGEQSRCLDLARSIYQQFRVETSAPRNLDGIRLR